MTTVDYDSPVLPLAELAKRKAELQKARSLTNPSEVHELRMLVQLFADLDPYEAATRRQYLNRDDFFPEFVRRLVENVTGHSWLDEWPYSCMNWERAIAEVRAECVEVDFRGHTYLVKAGGRGFALPRR